MFNGAGTITSFNVSATSATEKLPDRSPPPPPRAPPPPPLPVAPPGQLAVAVVDIVVTLGGYTAAAFGDTQTAAFKTGVSTSAGTTSDKVTVTSVADARRRLLAASITIAVEIEAATAAAASAAGAAVKAADLKAALVAAGLVATSSAAVTVAAVKTTFVDVASPPPPLVLNAVVAASTESWMTPGLNWFTGVVGGRV